MVKRYEACQFYAKQIHQPAQELQTIAPTWPFAPKCTIPLINRLFSGCRIGSLCW
jgi:hypothetical protein